MASFDVNLDGVDDIIVAPGPGQPARLRAVNGATLATLEDFTVLAKLKEQEEA